MKSQQLVKLESSPVALADMTIPELAQSFGMLDQVALEHENAHTICRILQGLVLLEVKRKLPHGDFGNWLKKNFKKSQDTAGNYMRVGQDFVAKLADPKFRVRSEFDAQTAVNLLRDDLKTTLERLGKVKLDLAHPLVRAATLYTKGRGFYQLMLELGPASKGGKTYDRSGGKGKRHKTTFVELKGVAVAGAKLAQSTASQLVEQKYFQALNGSQLDDLLHALDRAAEEVRDWTQKNAPERDLIFAHRIEKLLK
ncbi:MAG: DUF3102 domain-containing protein [Verrucomicrobiaceae bacterium]|nr:DUF3102 domain-containing protein [Verrucomicrobiaceae bacterium]